MFLNWSVKNKKGSEFVKNLSITPPAGMPKNQTWCTGSNGYKSVLEVRKGADGSITIPKEVSRSTSYEIPEKHLSYTVGQTKKLLGVSEQVVRVNEVTPEGHNKVVHKTITQTLAPIGDAGDLVASHNYTHKNGNLDIDSVRVNYGVIKPDAERIKTTTIKSTMGQFPDHKLVQIQRPDGFYSVSRSVGKDVVGGYEVIPESRRFADGFKGTMQKLARQIGSDANGCERTGLRRVANLFLKIAEKIK